MGAFTITMPLDQPGRAARRQPRIFPLHLMRRANPQPAFLKPRARREKQRPFKNAPLPCSLPHLLFSNKSQIMRPLALFALFLLPLALLLAAAGCSSSALSTKNIAGTYNAAPTRGSPSALKLVLNNDRTFLMFSRPPSATTGWQLVKQGRWKASGTTLKLQTPSKSDEKYQIQGFATSLTSSKKNAPIFVKETNAPFR